MTDTAAPPHAPPAAPGPPAVPDVEVLGHLGSGGMGVVWKVRQLRLNRLAALKTLSVGHTDAASALRFLIEAEVVARVQHPAVVQVYEFGRHDGTPYFLQEYVEGGTLADAIRSRGPFPPREAAGLVAAIADGVAAAHAKGVVHRDLKPSNVLLTPDGRPKVADFGIAKTASGAVTLTGMLLGTPAYMAPEQAEGRQDLVGTPSDVYGLGVVLYELLAGRPPFQGQAVLQLVREADPPPLRTPDRKVPRDLETICLKCLGKDPARRYPTAVALADDLRAFLDGRPIAARPVGPVGRGVKWARRNPALAAGLAVALLAVLAAIWAGVWLDRRAERERRTARAEGLVRTLGSVPTPHVPAVLAELAALDTDVSAPLRELADGPVHEKPGLHGRLALADDPRHLDELTGYLLRCRPDEVIVLRDALRRHADRFEPGLWAVLVAEGESRERRLRSACVLAGSAAGDPRWPAVATEVLGHLLAENVLDAHTWAAALDPVAPALVPPLLKRYKEDHQEVSLGTANARRLLRDAALDLTALSELAARNDLSAKLLARFAGDDPAALAELTLILTDRHYPFIADRLAARRDALVLLLRRELDAPAGPPDPTAARDERRTHAVAALAALGDFDAVWPLLPRSTDPTARSFLIQRLGVTGTDPAELVRRYSAPGHPSERAAVVLALGGCRPDRLPPAERDSFVTDLLKAYRDDPDPGLHSAVGWTLRHRWGRGPDVDAIDTALAKMPGPVRGRDWFVTPERQTLAVVRGPVEFLFGSPETEPHRIGVYEEQHARRIGHSFAIGTHEVTRVELNRFRKRNRGSPTYLPDDTVAGGGVSWYEAAEYCNWLSKLEGIPEDQWCYEPNPKTKRYEAGMRQRPDYLKLKGYRLPTEAEWEYACRAGTTTTRPYGRGMQLLPRYGWLLLSGADRAWPTGLLQPNDLGLFDVLGNLTEWTSVRFHPDLKAEPPPVVEATDEVEWAMRSPSFAAPENWARPARRSAGRSSSAGSSYSDHGLRLARTVD